MGRFRWVMLGKCCLLVVVATLYLSKTQVRDLSPVSTFRRLAQSPQSDATEVENGDDHVPNNRNVMKLQWRPFWTESVQALLQEGKEIAVAEINRTNSKDFKNLSISCEEHLKKGDFAAASGPFCGYTGAMSKKCFDIMDEETEWLLGSLLQHCLQDPAQWNATWQACRKEVAQTLATNTSSERKKTNRTSGLLKMACVKSCLGKEGCPAENFGRQPRPSSPNSLGGTFYDCNEIMFNHTVRLTWTNSTKRCEQRLQLGQFKSCRAISSLEIFYGDQLIFSIENESAQFSHGNEHYYDQFLYASFCMENGTASVNATRSSFKWLAPENFPSVWHYGGWGGSESRVLRQAAHAFVNFDGSTPDIFLGWPGCQAIIDNGIAKATERNVEDCKQTCARNFQSLSADPSHTAAFMGIPMWPLTLLNVALRIVVSVIALGVALGSFLFCVSASAMCRGAGWDRCGLALKVLGGCCYVAFGMVSVLLTAVLASDLISPTFFCPIANSFVLIWRVASGHRAAWVCIKASLFYDQFNTHWQYLVGALGLFVSTCLGFFLTENSTPQADEKSDEAEKKDKSRAFRSLLIAEVLCVIGPCASIVVVDLMQAFGWGWPLLSLPWWVVPLLTFVFGLLVIFFTQYRFFGNGPVDLYGTIEAVPGKMLIFDIFMDVSQMAGFYLLGQPYFALMQFVGLFANAFMSSVAPSMGALQISSSMMAKLDANFLMLLMPAVLLMGSLSAVVLITENQLWLMGWRGWFAILLIFVIGTPVCAVAFSMALALLVQVLALLILNRRSFCFSLFQADAFMSVWESYRRNLDTHSLLLKKLAEACGEGSLSLYLGLTAIFKARLAEGQSFALFQIFGNVLVTVYCMADGMASALELTAAEGVRMHTVTVTVPKATPDPWTSETHELQGSLIQKECPKSRLAFKSARSVDLVVAFRMAEILGMCIPFCLFAAAYGFAQTAVIYSCVGVVFMLVIVLVQWRQWKISWALFLLFLPSQSPATIPTIGHFEVEVVGRLVAALVAWLWMAQDFFVAKGDFHKYMETIRKSGSHTESNSTFWQSYMITTAAILGPIAWLAWASLLCVLQQKRVQWKKEDTARLVALAAEDPSMWFSGTKPNGLPALQSLPEYKPSLAEASTCGGRPCNLFTMEFIEQQDNFRCSQCHETQTSPCWFCDEHQTRWCMACSPPPCNCSECSAEKPAMHARSHRLALRLGAFRRGCDKCGRSISKMCWHHGSYHVCFDCIPVKGPAGFLQSNQPAEAAEAKPPPPIYPEFQQPAFIPLASFGGGETGEFAVGMPKEQWATLLETCPHILPPKVSESLLGSSELCKHFEPFKKIKKFAGFREGCSYEFTLFKNPASGGVSGEKNLETVVGVGLKDQSQVIVGGRWSATSEMFLTFFAEDSTNIEIRLSWVEPTSEDGGQLVGPGVVFHEVEVNDMDLQKHLQNQFTQKIYIPTGGHLLQSRALEVSRDQAELPKEYQVFEVSVADPPSVWGGRDHWQMICFKPCKEERPKPEVSWWSWFQELLKTSGCTSYSSLPQDATSAGPSGSAVGPREVNRVVRE